MFWNRNADSKTQETVKILTWSLYLALMFLTISDDYPPHPSHPSSKGYEFEVQTGCAFAI